VLNLELAIDRSGIHPREKATAHLVADVTAPADENAPKTRPRLTVVFVLDVSASMKGPPLDHVIRSVELLIALLSPQDRVGIVTFAQSASEVMTVRAATEDAKRDARAALQGLAASAKTNMEAGLRLAIDALPPRKGEERQLICLLTDGVPNVGLSTPLTLSELLRPARGRATLWALGYGPHHQEDILGALATAGSGRYEYIPEPQVCEFAFGKMLGAQGLIVADGVELVLRPSPGVEIRRFLPKIESRFTSEGIVLPLPDVFVGGKRLIVAELALEAPHLPNMGESRGTTADFPWPLVTAKLAFRGFDPKDRSSPRAVERSLSLMVTNEETHLLDDVYQGVLLAQCDEQRAEARAMADRGNFEGASAVLGRMIQTIERAPGYAPFDGSPLSEACEQLRDELQTMEKAPPAEEYKAFRRSHLSVSVSARDYARSTSTNELADPYTHEVMRVVAGDYPVASLEQLSGLEAGRFIQLRAEQVVGRAKTADIVVQSLHVGRFHAKLMAQRGTFFIMDLGSPSGTWLNEVRVETHLLSRGDVITIGDVKFRYDEQTGEARELRLMAFTEDGNIYVIEKDRLFVLGSSRACSMVIPSSSVGRQHAAVRYRDRRYWVEDYGSEFPTIRNGQRVKDRVEVKDGDEFIFGDFPVRFAFRP
jgi:Ca-activated chloride channel family protein